jgi:hypothetical protein
LYNNQNHIIRRQNVKVNAFTSDGMALQSRISRLLNEVIPEKLSRRFDDLVNPDEWLVIERLDINLESIDENEFESGFVELVVEKISAQIVLRRDQLKSGAIRTDKSAAFQDVESRIAEAFFMFLEKGILPWWFQNISAENFEDKIIIFLENIKAKKGLAEERFIETCKRIFSIKSAGTRFTEQFDEKVFRLTFEILTDREEWKELKEVFYLLFFEHKFQQIFEGRMKNLKRKFLEDFNYQPDKASIRELFNEVQKSFTIAERKQFLDELAKIKISVIVFENEGIMIRPEKFERNSEKLLTEFRSDVLTERNQINIDSSFSGLKLNDLIAAENGIIVQNAGLVILAPFLPVFFKDCGLVKDFSFSNTDRAIALLHYIVHGNLNYKEFNVTLNKILCGIEEVEPVSLIKEITEEEINKVNDLLTSVISHWKMLKNTSPDGLREGFLQREGKLSFKNDSWYLQVEQKTMDILLQNLPWSIGIIKLPWMKSFLKTEWV